MASPSEISVSTSTESQLNTFYSWSTLYKVVAGSIYKKSDILICLVHYILVNKNFRCLGVGEDKIYMSHEVGSVFLPSQWNEHEQKYALRYAHDNRLYLLIAHLAPGGMVINLLNIQNKEVSNMFLNPELVVENIQGETVMDLIPNVVTLAERFRRELVDPVFIEPKKNASTQTDRSMVDDYPHSSLRWHSLRQPDNISETNSFNYPEPYEYFEHDSMFSITSQSESRSNNQQLRFDQFGSNEPQQSQDYMNPNASVEFEAEDSRDDFEFYH